MAVQILAIKTTPPDNTPLSIVEVIWRNDADRQLGSTDRGVFAKWMNDNPTAVVYLRAGSNVYLVVSAFGNDTWYMSASMQPPSSVDALFLLPRYAA